MTIYRIPFIVNKGVEVILFIIVSTMTIAVFLQVLFRYVFGIPLYWSEELARYLMIWTVYLGASVGVRRGSHVGFTYLLNKASSNVARWLFLISHIGLLVFCLYFTFYGLTISIDNLDQMSPGLGIPVGVMYLVLPISGVLCTIQIIPILYRIIFEPKKLNPDHGAPETGTDIKEGGM